jgi:hypothetical protein
MRRIALALVVLALWAASAQAKLEIQDVEACYGPLGPPRKTLDVYPQDELHFRFVVTGCAADAEGKVDATLNLKLTNPKGEEVLSQTQALKGLLPLGGNTFPSSARVALGERVPPGEYLLNATVTDNQSNEKAAFERKLNCKPVEFAVVAPEFFLDPEFKVPAALPTRLGQMLIFRTKVIGIDRSQEKIDVVMTLQAVDAKGNATMPKPMTFEVKNDDPATVRKVASLTFRAPIGPNRVGDFTLRIGVTDRIANKTTRLELPLRVIAP